MDKKEKMLELSDADANRLFGKDTYKLDAIERNNAASLLRKGYTDAEAAYMSTNPSGKLRPDPDAKAKPIKKAKGGAVKYRKGGSIDGCAVKGKTRGKMV
jgi:hypothetical protein